MSVIVTLQAKRDPAALERLAGDDPERMRDAGITAAPEVTFWRKLETHDEVGWD